jgi:hypothetical protein
MPETWDLSPTDGRLVAFGVSESGSERPSEILSTGTLIPISMLGFSARQA